MASILKPENYTISEDSLRIVNLLSGLLDRVEGVFEANGVPLPSRRYWMLGPEAPEDCAQVVVTFVSGTLGTPGSPERTASNCTGMTTATITVTVTRDHPVGPNGTPVNPKRIVEGSSWGAIDAATLLFNLQDITADPLLGFFEVTASVSVAPPAGGVQTTTLTLGMAIP
mgnify:CR=1 FL=1